MPLQHQHRTSTQTWALWKITEDLEELKTLLDPAEEIPTAISHPTKQCEFVASRVLTQSLVKQFNQPYQGIFKDEHGKPYLLNSSLHISQSHSYPYVAVILDSKKNVGIDIEQKKATLFRVASRIFSEAEVENAGNNLTKLCILWCAKEALIKLYGKKDLNLKEEIAIDEFTLGETGFLSGNILKKHHEKLYSLQYLVQEDFALVFNP